MKVSIVGPTGYTGRELVKILLRHPDVDDIRLFGRRRVLFHQEYPEFLGVFEREVEDIDPTAITEGADVVFIALPHKISMEVTPGIRAASPEMKIIDLSADYRIKDQETYQKAYGVAHKDSSFLDKYVYGLCEAFRKDIADAQYIANPGCYPTSVQLPLLPLLEKGWLEGTVIADSKSGTSGAGKGLSQKLHFVECHENLSPYKIFNHQHVPEMMQFVEGLAGDIDLVFTPHLVPLERGILTVLYVKKTKVMEKEDLYMLFEERFKDETFVRVLPKGEIPNLLNVRNTNFCDIGVFAEKNKDTVIIISAIDNLVKGASGQAVQNMNILLGLEEKAGLV